MSAADQKGGMRNYSAPLPEIFPPPESHRPTLVGERYMVVAGHPLVAQVATSVLEKGGNAIDAGVAAGLASNVLQADMCNLGGVAPILIKTANSPEVWSISGVGVWGQGVEAATYRERYGNDMPEGAPCSVVPAAVDSWITALKRFGTWSFSDVAKDAIDYAEQGFILDHRTALAYALMGEGFNRWESTAKIYWPNGRAPVEGDRLCQRDLAKLLIRIASAETGSNREHALENARAAFYSGPVADAIVEWVQRHGGWMELSDLEKFHNQVTIAKSYQYKDWRVCTGDIYCQGPVLLQALSILSKFDLSCLEHNSADYLHVIIESLKLAFSDREKYYGDPRYTYNSVEELLEDEHVERLFEKINWGSVLPDLATIPDANQSAPIIETPLARKHDTTNFSIIDSEGNAFSCSPSDTIDGNPIVEGLGIMVSPRGVQSRLQSDHPASIQTGKMPRLTPAPAIALKSIGTHDFQVMALSGCGGDVIPQGLLQVFLNYVEAGLTPQQSVEAPRIATLAFPDSFFPHVYDPGRLHVESRVSQSVRADLAGRGHRIRVWPEYEFDASGTALVLDLKPPLKQRRILAGAADPRRSLYALGR